MTTEEPETETTASAAGEQKPIDQLLRERIARRAHEISQSDEAGSDEENWLRAEQEIQAAHEARSERQHEGNS